MVKRGSALFLQGVIVIVAAGVLAWMLWEPTLEGRNAHATLVQIYFHDRFLAYAYTASIAFFVAMAQAFKLLGYVGRKEVFSPAVGKALRTIKYCAIILIVFIAGGEAHSFLYVRGHDDIAGGVMIGLALIVLSAVVAAAAAALEQILLTAIELKSGGC